MPFSEDDRKVVLFAIQKAMGNDCLSEAQAMPTGKLLLKDSADSRAFVEALRAVPALAGLEGLHLHLVNTSTGINLFIIGSWLLGYALENGGPDKAIDRLEAFMEPGGVQAIEIMLVHGIHVEDRCEISESISLLPAAMVPSESFQATYAARAREYAERRQQRLPWNAWERELPKLSFPTCALVRQLSGTVADYNAKPALGPSELQDVVKFLSMFGPSSPAAEATWLELEDHVPYKGYLAVSWSQSEVPSDWTFPVAPQAAELADAANLYRSLKGFDARTHGALLVALQRLGQASRRGHIVDQFIDLGIALEAALLSGQGDNEPLAMPFRLRGAYLLAGKDLEYRRRLERFLNSIYGLRSKAVHTGAFSSQNALSLDGTQKPLFDVLPEALRICSAIIKAQLLLGRPPNWNSLILGGDP